MLQISVFTLIMSWLFPYNKKAKQLIQLLGSINGTPDRSTHPKNQQKPITLNLSDYQQLSKLAIFINIH